MYQLEIIQGNNVIKTTNADVEALTQFVNDYIVLFGPEIKFSISEM